MGAHPLFPTHCRDCVVRTPGPGSEYTSRTTPKPNRIGTEGSHMSLRSAVKPHWHEVDTETLSAARRRNRGGLHAC